jgi:hypothetical protein
MEKRKLSFGFKKKRLLEPLTLISIFHLTSACGPQLADIGYKNETTSSPSSEGPKEDLVSISVRVEEKKNPQASSFNLADATSFTVILTGCASGQTGTATQSDPSLGVYKFDQSCVGQLTSFQFNGSTYTPDPSDGFESYAIGDSATFIDALNPNNKFRVVVTSQLNSPISGTESISYSFSQILAGDDQKFAEEVVSAPHTVSVSGIGAPAFKVKELSYVGMTAQGAGQFQFKLECDATLTGTGGTTACQDNLLSSLRYKLVKDTFGGVLDITQAASLFTTGGISIDPTEVIPVGNGSLPKGGFMTPPAADAEVLTGPNQMHLNPNMLLVIEASATSYTYYNVDVSIVNN